MNQDMYWFLIEAKYRYQKLDATSLSKMNQYRKMCNNVFIFSIDSYTLSVQM